MGRVEGKQPPFAYELDDSLSICEFGEPPQTALAEGIRPTAEMFERLCKEARLDHRYLDTKE